MVIIKKKHNVNKEISARTCNNGSHHKPRRNHTQQITL